MKWITWEDTFIAPIFYRSRTKLPMWSATLWCDLCCSPSDVFIPAKAKSDPHKRHGDDFADWKWCQCEHLSSKWDSGRDAAPHWPHSSLQVCESCGVLGFKDYWGKSRSSRAMRIYVPLLRGRKYPWLCKSCLPQQRALDECEVGIRKLKREILNAA